MIAGMETCPKCKLLFPIGIVRSWKFRYSAVVTLCPLCALQFQNSSIFSMRGDSFGHPVADELLRRARAQFKDVA